MSGCVATKKSSFSQTVPAVERLSKTYMTLDNISWGVYGSVRLLVRNAYWEASATFQGPH